jgi:hypothetical protein
MLCGLAWPRACIWLAFGLPAYSRMLARVQVWRQNTEAERLLGVSMTGVMDNTLTSGRRGQVKGVLQQWHLLPSSHDVISGCR